MEDEQCPICKRDLDEIVVSDDKTLFDKKLRRKCEEDPEDDTIYYHNKEAKEACLKLRTLNCMIHNCAAHRTPFLNQASL